MRQIDRQANLLATYLDSLGSTNTRRAYRSDLTGFFGIDTITEGIVQAVSVDDVDEYLKEAGNQIVKASTMQRRLSSLRSFFAWLVSKDILEYNPASIDSGLHRHLPRLAPKNTTITSLTRSETEQLLDAVDPESSSFVRNQTLLLVLLHCVLRRSEARTMDFEHLRKVDRFWVLDLPFTKGGADQYVKVPEHVAEAILAHKKHYAYSDGPVWRSMSRNSFGNRLSTTSIYTIVRKTAERAGIAARVGAHTLRHTGCTLAIESGASLQQVQAHARHKNLETTMIYVHQRDRLSDSAADYIDVSSRDKNSPQSDE